MHIRGFRDIELQPARVGFMGIFTVELIHARTGLIKRRLQFSNLITDVGLDSIGGSTAISDGLLYFAVGTNSATPANSDTTLGAEVGRTNSNGGFSDSNGTGPSTAYSFLKRTRLFLEAQANGNLTEVGALNASSGGTLFTRQLLKDELGNPTTITKTSSDQLKIIYEIRAYLPADATGTINISGIDYAYTIRSHGFGWQSVIAQSSKINTIATQLSNGNTLVSKSADIAGGSLPSSSTPGSYTSGNHYIDFTTISQPTNFTTAIGSIFFGFGNNGFFQHAFTTTKLPKDNTKKLTYVGRISWDRYTP